MQFQIKGGISDGVLRVTYYNSRGFVSCNFIFHIADPTYCKLTIVQSIIFKWSLTNLLYLSHVFWVAEKPTCLLLKWFDMLSQKHLCCKKKGEAKKVQVTEWPKDLWGQEEKLYQPAL